MEDGAWRTVLRFFTNWIFKFLYPIQYLETVRHLEGYSRTTFPQCQFEVPKSDECGLATLSVDFSSVILKIQQEESQKVSFPEKWTIFMNFTVLKINLAY